MHGIRYVFGPTLDYRLKETFLKHLKGVLSIHFRVCLSTKKHTFTFIITVSKMFYWLLVYVSGCLPVCLFVLPVCCPVYIS